MLAIAVCALVALLVADTAWWFHAQRRLDADIALLARSAAARGWRISAQAGERGGWPWAGRLTLHDATAARTGVLRWSDERLVIEASPFRRDRLLLSPLGTEELRFPGAAPIRLWGSHLLLDRARHGPLRLALTADALHLGLGGFGPDDTVQAAAVAAELRRTPTGLHLSATIRDLAFPGTSTGRVVPETRLDADFPDQPAAGTGAPLARSWPPPGGRIVIDEAGLRWDDASASLSGEAVRDTDGTASGRFTLLLRDPDAIVSRLRTAGLLGPGQEIAVRAVLDLIRSGENGEGDDASAVRLPLELDHGLVRLGRIPLARLPPLGPVSSPPRPPGSLPAPG
ncbi:MAG: DUF2125 domain-containing protein [Gluconacetobacter diazotrophicus]|nr:DUF2125 domain-containing protein [Gluconacetobacter diazotrophicus]